MAGRRPPPGGRALGLAAGTLRGIVVANLKLSRLILTPSLPLRSGMVIVPTAARSDGGLAAVGLITSLIVDNQIVDVDRARHLLQYHAVCVPEGGREQAREAINGPVERMLEPLTGGRAVHELYIVVAFAELVVGGLLLVRLAIGPTMSDRVVALNALSTQATLSLLFFAAFADRTSYLDVALWLASFSYLGTFVWARLLERELL